MQIYKAWFKKKLQIKCQKKKHDSCSKEMLLFSRRLMGRWVEKNAAANWCRRWNIFGHIQWEHQVSVGKVMHYFPHFTQCRSTVHPSKTQWSVWLRLYRALNCSKGVKNKFAGSWFCEEAIRMIKPNLVPKQHSQRRTLSLSLTHVC